MSSGMLRKIYNEKQDDIRDFNRPKKASSFSLVHLRNGKQIKIHYLSCILNDEFENHKYNILVWCRCVTRIFNLKKKKIFIVNNILI